MNRGGDQAGKGKPDRGPSPWSRNSEANDQVPPEDTEAGLVEIGNWLSGRETEIHEETS
jgi:hypothetical protein